MPEEIYIEKGKTTDDGSLANVLSYGIVPKARVSVGLSSIDGANCYNIIAHVIASLVFQAFGIPGEAIESMLTAIEDMKYFLHKQLTETPSILQVVVSQSTSKGYTKGMWLFLLSGRSSASPSFMHTNRKVTVGILFVLSLICLGT